MAGEDSIDAIESSLALLALYGRLHPWPPVEDPTTAREDELARQSWDKLRAAYLSK